MEIEVEVLGPLGTVEHAYSHFRITLHAYHALRVRGEPAPRAATDWAWVRPGELDDLAFPAANVRLLARLREQGPPEGAGAG
jgi:A/G-specific adenine glycosylase